ncbi:Release factor glutamine methyltransferase [Methylophilaceae bacterium]|nr:Release factor glutamine methyltransferase [Methylophilaceae bacterium]
MSIHARLNAAQQRLKDTLGLNSREARLEARLLLQDILGVNHAWLLSHENDALEDQAGIAFQSLLTRRLSGEPMAHILGRREFFGLDLGVTANTLIPRPDTETLVEAALQRIPQNAPCKVLDLGTGTGAIALAIASRRPHAEVLAVDFSETALQVAIDNAARLGISNVRFLQSNWFSGVAGQIFDIIVSNPPYIAAGDIHLTRGDLRFEPLSALVSGDDGLDDIWHIIAATPQHLNQNGWLLLEHGYDQAERVAGLMRQHHFLEIGHTKDLAQIPRVTFGQFNRQ